MKEAQAYECVLPEIETVSITPNPVYTRETLLISVSVVEVTKTFYPEPIYSGEFYTGEDIL